MILNNFSRGLAVVTLLFSAGILFAQDQDEEIQQLYGEYLQISQRLQNLQQRALQDEVIAAEAEEYSQLLNDKMTALSPESAELVKQREETIDKIESAQEKGHYAEIQDLHQTYEKLSQQLQPYMQRVLEDKEVQVKQQSLEDALLSKMEELDPETYSLLARLNELSEDINRLMQE